MKNTSLFCNSNIFMEVNAWLYKTIPHFLLKYSITKTDFAISEVIAIYSVPILFLILGWSKIETIN